MLSAIYQNPLKQPQDALKNFTGDVLILYGDVPLTPTRDMARLLERLNSADRPAAVILGFRPDDAGHYGRIIADADGRISKMVEYKDASAEERAVTLCNSGLMAVRAEDLWPLLARVENKNAAGEYYLPDIVMLALKEGRHACVIETETLYVTGVNARTELAALEAAWQQQRRHYAMENGATLIAPETVFFAHDTELGRDVVIEPHVVFGPGVYVGDGSRIRAFSHLEGAKIGKNCEIGPYARLRAGSVMEDKARVGNFVEMKKTRLGAGAKANHLTYLGDSDVGEGANVGAGTITCNYDGFFKYRTTIGKGAFIGSNSALVAPVVIGDGAIVGAGSVITGDVDADALALARGTQTAKLGWASRFRAAMQAKKKAETK